MALALILFPSLALAQPCMVSVTAAGGALTGSVNYPCSATFPDGNTINIVAPVTMTIGADSTLGFVSNQPGRLWWELMEVSGSAVLGVEKATTPTQLYGIDEDAPQSSVACNACTNAGLPGVIYSTAAQANAPIVVVGYSTWEVGPPTAGTWTAPTVTRLRTAGTVMPGHPTGRGVSFTCPAGAYTPGNSTSFTPTLSTVTLSLHSAANMVSVFYSGSILLATGNATIITGVLRGGTLVAPGLVTYSDQTADTNGIITPISDAIFDFPQSISASWTVGFRTSTPQSAPQVATYGGDLYSDAACKMSAMEYQG